MKNAIKKLVLIQWDFAVKISAKLAHYMRTKKFLIVSYLQIIVYCTDKSMTVDQSPYALF